MPFRICSINKYCVNVLIRYTHWIAMGTIYFEADISRTIVLQIVLQLSVKMDRVSLTVVLSFGCEPVDNTFLEKVAILRIINILQQPSVLDICDACRCHSESVQVTNL